LIILIEGFAAAVIIETFHWYELLKEDLPSSSRPGFEDAADFPDTALHWCNERKF